MTLQERCESFAGRFPKWPAAWPRVVRESSRDVLYATWVLGNDYRNKTKYYGAYPPGYLARIDALFPDVCHETNQIAPTPDAQWPVLHMFAGSLPPGPYLRVDTRFDQDAHVMPDLRGSVYNISYLRGGSEACNWLFSLVLADPPYSAADADQYGTGSVDKRRATAALAQVTRVGGHLVWLDTCWPMHRKAEWLTVGRIAIIRSTNHRVRMATIFERAA